METKGKLFVGVIVSTAMTQTVVVEVERHWRHPLYKKTVKKTKNFMAHVASGEYVVGDRVQIQEVKPISKYKHFLVIGKVAK
jgi:small subunit ribosomal protein S17